MKIVLNGLVCLMVAGTMFAQANAQPEITPRAGTSVQDLPTPGPETQVAPDAAVITIKGVCEKSSSAASADCNTIVTRADFEKFIDAVNPNLPKPMQKQLATRLVTAMILAQKAHTMGLDQGPAFDEQMYLSRLQVLARLAEEQMQKSNGQASDTEIEDYYKQHGGEFRTISYEKIYLPLQKPGTQISPNDPEAQKKRQAAQDEMKQEAEKLRTRAAAGEDFVKLQQEAYDFAGVKATATASNTRADKVAKARMLPSDATIFDLKKGDVSQIITNPQGMMIYKVEDLQDQPLADVRDQIKRSLEGEKSKAALESLQKQSTQDATYNDAYFAVPPAPSLRKPGEAAPAPAATMGKPTASPAAPGKK